MAVVIKQLAAGQMGTSFNSDLSGTTVGSGKAQIIKNLRFCNTHTTQAVTLNVLVYAQSSYRQISPKDLSIPAGGVYVDDHEITLEVGNKFKATTGATGGPVDWVISGVERAQA